MPFRKPKNIPYEPLTRVPKETVSVIDPFDGTVTHLEMDPYASMPAAELGDLKTLLKAGVNLKEVSTAIFPPQSMNFAAEKTEVKTDSIEHKDGK